MPCDAVWPFWHGDCRFARHNPEQDGPEDSPNELTHHVDRHVLGAAVDVGGEGQDGVEMAVSDLGAEGEAGEEGTGDHDSVGGTDVGFRGK